MSIITSLLGLNSWHSQSNRSSGTYTRASLGSMVQKGKFIAGMHSFVRVLNKVDFPTLGSPTCKRITVNYDINMMLNMMTNSVEVNSGLLRVVENKSHSRHNQFKYWRLKAGTPTIATLKSKLTGTHGLRTCKKSTSPIRTVLNNKSGDIGYPYWRLQLSSNSDSTWLVQRLTPTAKKRSLQLSPCEITNEHLINTRKLSWCLNSFTLPRNCSKIRKYSNNRQI